MATHETEPDYTRCSVKELYEVRRWIDPERFPERAATLEAEIAAREAMAKGRSSREEPTPRPGFRVFRDPRTLGLYMLVAGTWSLAWSLDAVIRQANSSRLIPYGIVIGAYMPLAISGAMVTFRQPGWRQAALIAWLIQLPAIHVGSLTYVVFAPPAVEWKLWPLVGFSASGGPVLSVELFREPREFYLGVNAIALAAISFLALRLSMRAEARHRAQRHSDPMHGAG